MEVANQTVKVVAKSGKIGKFLSFLYEHWQHIISIILFIIVFAPAITNSISQKSMQPFYDGVIFRIGGAGIYENKIANEIIQNNYHFPIIISQHPEKINGFFSSMAYFFKNIWWHTKAFFLRIWYFIINIFEPLWFVYYTWFLLYILFRWFEDSKIARAVFLATLIIFIIFTFTFGIINAHISRDKINGTQYEEKVFEPFTGFYKIANVMYQMIENMFSGVKDTGDTYLNDRIKS